MRSVLAAVVAALSNVLGAATVGPEWCVAYPETGSADVNAALKAIAEEVRADVNEATGLKLEAVSASKAKAPAIYIGAEFAKKAGFDLSGLAWYDNVVAERDGSIYLFGNDRPGRKASKSRRLGWTFCVIPSVKAATRFLETAAGVRFLMPGEVGKEVPRRDAVSLADGTCTKESPRSSTAAAGMARWCTRSRMGYGALSHLGTDPEKPLQKGPSLSLALLEIARRFW